MTCRRRGFCARLLAFGLGIIKVRWANRRAAVPSHLNVSNSDQLFFRGWAIITLEMSIASRSFRSSELSQPI
jgi:hypothetical protein